jgi:hypothetical protein
MLFCESKRTKTTAPDRDNNEIWGFDEQPPLQGLKSPFGPGHIDTLYFNRNPLTELIAMDLIGYKNPFKYECMVSDDSREGIYKDALFSPTIEEAIQIQDQVTKHYNNKFLMMRLKGIQATKWQQKVERFLKNPLELQGNSVKPVIKLYDFYKCDKKTEAILKDATSLFDSEFRSDQVHFQDANISGVVDFAGKVDRHDTRGVTTTFYWKTKEGYLITKRVRKESESIPVWEFMAQQGKIKIEADCSIMRVSGYSHLVYVIQKDRYKVFNVLQSENT